jgi:hypothetical protein
MPHNFYFSNIEIIKTIEVNPDGWISPLYVEYGIVERETLWYYWRVKGTLHTFIIPVSRMDFLSSGDYKKHLEDALGIFREDYLSWQKEGFKSDWAKQYEQQYSRFIII